MARGGRAKKRAGHLVIIGGAEDRRGKSVILHEFVRLAGGRGARVSVISAASETPHEAAAPYLGVFKRLGVRDVRALGVGSRADADKSEFVDAVGEATGVFFTGGSQLRITSLLGGTKLDAALHERHAAGLVLAGTSAGAAVMSSVMIVGSTPGAGMRAGGVELGPGMDFLPGVVIDQHFEERGRLRRLLSAIAQYPHDLGLGVDENTAAVVSGGVLEVFGEGSVTIIDAGGMVFTNLNDLKRNELLAICGVRVHILPAGYRFDLGARAPLLDGAGVRG